MKRDTVNINGYDIEIYSLNTVIVGTGAAGYNAAGRLWDYGQRDIAVVTEGINMGTSRNTGSDKQTYYKITLAGGGEDSVVDMAKTLFNGGCMHGDIALCEAAMSTQCFYRLVELGVPFPYNEYGEYVGYKTDHDPRQRATSAGPLTSKFMTEKLEKDIKNKNIEIFDNYRVIGIITENQVCYGLLAINKKENGFLLFNCKNVVFATGAPAGLYSCSVFPESQTGSTGTAFEAGVRGRNLTEWQYGIASIKFRWNLSGTYQQVIPCYVSTDKDGGDAREFLDEYYKDPQKMLDGIFLKGYQWPFDPRKIDNYGSSLIDILVYNEIETKGRRVWLDFLNNPSVMSTDFNNLGKEAYDYLKKSNALLKTPIERLAHMNTPAIELYKNNGIDLYSEMLEIAVCAQHNNGGLAVNSWWETNIDHFFAVGEVAGTHGVYRPGGSALNSGQVGSTRAAMYISRRYGGEPLNMEEFIQKAKVLVSAKIDMANSFLKNSGSNVKEIRSVIGNRMSKYAAAFRNAANIETIISEAELQLRSNNMSAQNWDEIVTAFENIDLLIAQQVYAYAMVDYVEKNGKSRGSYMVYDKDGIAPVNSVGYSFNFSLDSGILSKIVQEIVYHKNGCSCSWEQLRPIPNADYWFENVWNEYRSISVKSKL